ncbi:MAG: addiction module protein [Methylotenera sp.]|nr:addiction module protein [Flavobacterium sp.]
MSLQIIQNSKGENTGVFIPMDDWEIMKTNYPDVDNLDKEIPDWQKQLLDSRLEDIARNPKNLRPISELFEELDRDT